MSKNYFLEMWSFCFEILKWKMALISDWDSSLYDLSDFRWLKIIVSGVFVIRKPRHSHLETCLEQINCLFNGASRVFRPWLPVKESIGVPHYNDFFGCGFSQGFDLSGVKFLSICWMSVPHSPLRASVAPRVTAAPMASEDRPPR